MTHSKLAFLIAAVAIGTSTAGADELSDLQAQMQQLQLQMKSLPADLQFQNERQRMGSWFAVSQQLTKNTNLNFGWARQE